MSITKLFIWRFAASAKALLESSVPLTEVKEQDYDAIFIPGQHDKQSTQCANTWDSSG